MADATRFQVKSKQIVEQKQATDAIATQMEKLTQSQAQIDELIQSHQRMEAMMAALMSQRSNQLSRPPDPPYSASGDLTSYSQAPQPPDPPDIRKSRQDLTIEAPDPPDFNQSELASAIQIPNELSRRYSCEEIHERMTNGLCIFCEDLDTPGHYNLKHKRSKLCLVECVDDGLPDAELVEPAVEGISDKSVNMIREKESNTENESRPEFSHQALFSQVQHTPTNQYRAPFNPCQNHSDKPHNKSKFGNCIGHEIESDRDSDEIEDDELQDKQPEDEVFGVDVETLVMNEDEKPLECDDEIVSLDKESDLVIVEEIVVASVLKFPTTFTCMRKTYILIDPGDAASGNNIQTGHKCGDLENWSLQSEDDFYKIKNQQQQVNNRKVILRLVIPVIVERAVKRKKDYDGALLAPLDDTVAFSNLDAQQLRKQQLDPLLMLIRMIVVPFSTLILMTCKVLELIKDKASRKRKLCKNWWFKYKLNTWFSEALHFWRKRKYEKIQRASEDMVCGLIYKTRKACHCVVHETNLPASHVWYGWKTKGISPFLQKRYRRYGSMLGLTQELHHTGFVKIMQTFSPMIEDTHWDKETWVKLNLESCKGGSLLEFLKRHDARFDMIKVPNNTRFFKFTMDQSEKPSITILSYEWFHLPRPPELSCCKEDEESTTKFSSLRTRMF